MKANTNLNECTATAGNEVTTNTIKTANDYLKEIESGKPYTYNAALTPKRKFTITLNDRGDFVLLCNNLKMRQLLRRDEVVNIINNGLEMEK